MYWEGPFPAFRPPAGFWLDTNYWDEYKGKYMVATFKVEGGDVLGPWVQQFEPLYESDGGHGMIFKTFEGQVMLTLHSPNQTPNERVVFIELQEDEDSIQLKEEFND